MPPDSAISPRPALPPMDTWSFAVLLSAMTSAVAALLRKTTAESAEAARKIPVAAGFALPLMNGAVAAAVKQLPPELARQARLPVLVSP